MGLGDEKYILLTTFKRSGDAVATPVWAVSLDDGTIGFWTSSGSGKAKRLAHTAKVTVQPSDARGRVKDGTSAAEGTAVVVAADDPRYAEIQRKVKAKYGFMTKITKFLGTVMGTLKRKRIPYGDCAVVITVG
ncbi:MAG: PPOX class F420-dependent oxidoreductase [Ilumatobacteraceae bacterium]|nr:PPOX class F420-dependent oxidoreductase [Ilumatobacter sp.]MCB0979209.1 PPOX class F420-dependent oxidoreductase [Ilumatobacter sp.]MCO5331980.1 PPOX class F420-dependent oxidoreductase [Ilumatobacteraceae bacterium]